MRFMEVKVITNLFSCKDKYKLLSSLYCIGFLLNVKSKKKKGKEQ